MAESDINAEVKSISDTVTGIRLDFVETKGEIKATNKSVGDLCGKLDRYAVGTEKRLEAIESDVGNRIPDDPTAFSQIQSLQGYRRRTSAGLKMLWGLFSAIVLMGLSEIFGWFKKGN